MAHPSSVISLTIADYRQDFYDKLTAMETYTYDESSLGGVAEYQPFWQAYSDAIVGYFGNTVTGTDDFLVGLFGFLFNYLKRSRGPEALYDDSDAFVVFDLNGLVADVLGYPVAYYDDYDSGTGNAPRLQADTSAAGSAFGPDNTAFQALPGEYSDVLQGFAVGDLLTGSAPPSGPFPPSEAWSEIFEALNWGVVFDSFGLTIPDEP